MAESSTPPAVRCFNIGNLLDLARCHAPIVIIRVRAGPRQESFGNGGRASDANVGRAEFEKEMQKFARVTNQRLAEQRERVPRYDAARANDTAGPSDPNGKTGGGKASDKPEEPQPLIP